MILVVAATEAELEGAAGAATLECGVGPVEAAASTARALAGRRPDALLHVGIAGARRGCGLETRALVLGSEAVYCDLASSAPGRVAPDAGLLEAARRALPEARLLPIGTSAAVGGTAGCGVDVEAMEGFAVLRAAQLAGVPALELRSIANEIEQPDRKLWRFEEAFDALAAALPRLLESLRR